MNDDDIVISSLLGGQGDMEIEEDFDYSPRIRKNQHFNKKSNH
jgi:hypothetical protein